MSDRVSDRLAHLSATVAAALRGAARPSDVVASLELLSGSLLGRDGEFRGVPVYLADADCWHARVWRLRKSLAERVASNARTGQMVRRIRMQLKPLTDAAKRFEEALA